ncbi:MAG: type II toxin-antitoxin system VapC family toxin [Actinomycetota bacterium]|nr:type II toxin-antitoxin system VapC family toxin [Actinomycetota bacterium]
MSLIVLDTDVASRIVKRPVPSTLASALAGRQGIVSFVTIGELTKWINVRDLGDRRRSVINSWIDAQQVLGGGPEVARKWGEITAFAQLRGRPKPQNDSWIAAVCLTYEVPLATLNVKDFDDFAEYEGLEIITA